MWNHVAIMFLHGLDILHAFRSHEGLSVMCHDCNHDSHVNAMMSQCECDDLTHAM